MRCHGTAHSTGGCFVGKLNQGGRAWENICSAVYADGVCHDVAFTPSIKPMKEPRRYFQALWMRGWMEHIIKSLARVMERRPGTWVKLSVANYPEWDCCDICIFAFQRLHILNRTPLGLANELIWLLVEELQLGPLFGILWSFDDSFWSFKPQLLHPVDEAQSFWNLGKKGAFQ